MGLHGRNTPSPVSIEITAKGAKPVVTLNDRVNEDRTTNQQPYVNPWNDLGTEEDRATVTVGYQIGYRQALE